MKSRIILIIILIIILLILTGHNNSGFQRLILDFINPVRIAYKEFTTEIESKSKSYIFQKNQIDKLSQENRVLRKYLFDQTHYIKQLSTLYENIPSLRKLPYKDIALVDTISYVKLNKFDQILLSPPKNYELNSSKVYGLVQKEQVAGIAKLEDGHLYGYLISNPECSFSVIVGKNRYPGVAFGRDHNSVVVKFIPKWADVKEGDFVQTSGLDGIFFAYVPVGVVKSVSIEESYKVVVVKTIANIMHPDIFFLILNPKPYLVSYYDKDKAFPDKEYKYKNQPPLKRDDNLTSLPITNQTTDDHFDPTEFEIPLEEEVVAPKPTPKKPKEAIKPKPKKPKTKKPKPKPKKPKHIKEPTTPPPAPPPPPPKEEKKKPSPFDILRA